MSEGVPNEPHARLVPRWLACLVKGPLGCLAFVLGAAVVLVLLLPAALGRLLERTLERAFAERHAGSLELDDAWLGSLYGAQRVERVILRDPGGDEVLRGELVAPSLGQVLEGPLRRYGPVELRIEALRLVQAEDGTTNLERALRARPREPADDTRPGGLTTDVPFVIELDVTVARLRYSGASGKEALLEDLAFHGTLEWGPEATHLVLEGGSESSEPEMGDGEALHARVELERPEFGPRRPWTCALALDGAPTVLARALCAAARPLAPLAGARTDRLQWSVDGSEVALLFEDEGLRLELLGQEHEGLVGGGAEDTLTASLACTSAPGRALLAGLVPLVVALECLDPGLRHELSLTEFRWPLDGDWSALSGVLALTLAPTRCTLLPVLGEQFGEPLPLVSQPDALHARLDVRAGLLEYAQLRLPLEQGWLQVDGTLELASGQGVLRITGEHAGAALEPLQLAGKHDALVPGPRPPPPLPTVPASGVPAPPGEDG